jgi:DNA-binding NarL/FixJ family response regulator
MARTTAQRREAERRHVVALLHLGASTCEYAARRLAGNLDPGEARQAAWEVAQELAEVAAAVLRSARPGPAERRAAAARLRGLGLSERVIALRLGVSERSVRVYLSARPG